MKGIFSASDFVHRWKVQEQGWAVATWAVVIVADLRNILEPFEKMVTFQLQGGSIAKYPLATAQIQDPSGSDNTVTAWVPNPEWEASWTVSDAAIVAAWDAAGVIQGTFKSSCSL